MTIKQSNLSIRQEQLLHLLTKGLTNLQCAGFLGISERSAEQLRRRLMTKTGCTSAVELGVWACQRNYHVSSKRLTAPVTEFTRSSAT